MSPVFIDIQDVQLEMPGVDHPILAEITYQIQQGDFVILLGSNGSGKSSLLKLLNRSYCISSGSIVIDGKSVNSYSSYELSRLTTLLTQNCHESLFTSLTVFENYKIFSPKQKNARAFFLKYIVDFNPNLARKLNVVVDKLSGGEKQALALALAVLSPPKMLLLDEHTSALDPKTAKQLMQLTCEVVAAHNITCVLTTHDLEIAKLYGNRIMALRNGKIHQLIEGVEKKNLTQQELFAACY